MRRENASALVASGQWPVALAVTATRATSHSSLATGHWPLTTMIKPFIAASSYLNAAPLWYSFLYGEQKSRCTLVSDVAPIRCAQLLVENRADAALIAVIEYPRHADMLSAPCARI